MNIWVWFALALALAGVVRFVQQRPGRPLRRLACAFGFHGRGEGMFEHFRHDPVRGTLDYRNYIGCQYCRRELKK